MDRPGSKDLIHWFEFILWSASSFRGGPREDLFQQGWVSALARQYLPDPLAGVRRAQSALMASEQPSR